MDWAQGDRVKPKYVAPVLSSTTLSATYFNTDIEHKQKHGLKMVPIRQYKGHHVTGDVTYNGIQNG